MRITGPVESELSTLRLFGITPSISLEVSGRQSETCFLRSLSWLSNKTRGREGRKERERERGGGRERERERENDFRTRFLKRMCIVAVTKAC